MIKETVQCHALRMVAVIILSAFGSVNVFAQDCGATCFKLFKLTILNQAYQNSITAYAYPVDGSGSANSTAGSTVHGEWTLPDGTTKQVNSNVSIRHRSQSTLATSGIPGVYTYRVTDITKSGYTYDNSTGADPETSVVIGSATNLPPVASITADIMSGTAPLYVAFDASQSSDADGYIAAYSWNFGDGATSSEASITHVYDQAGTYTATLTVIDDKGALNSKSVIIEVQNETQACVSNCARVNSLALTYSRWFSRITARVIVIDENKNNLRSALVTGFWTLPDGSIIEANGSTNYSGKASFNLPDSMTGKYLFTVTGIDLSAYSFDVENSGTLTGDITVSP